MAKAAGLKLEEASEARPNILWGPGLYCVLRREGKASLCP